MEPITQTVPGGSAVENSWQYLRSSDTRTLSHCRRDACLASEPKVAHGRQNLSLHVVPLDDGLFKESAGRTHGLVTTSFTACASSGMRCEWGLPPVPLPQRTLGQR